MKLNVCPVCAELPFEIECPVTPSIDQDLEYSLDEFIARCEAILLTKHLKKEEDNEL